MNNNMSLLIELCIANLTRFFEIAIKIEHFRQGFVKITAK